MAGSYNHATTDEGKLRNTESMIIATENRGDTYETIEEMYGMIWYLAGGSAKRVERARDRYHRGINIYSPGREPEEAS